MYPLWRRVEGGPKPCWFTSLLGRAKTSHVEIYFKQNPMSSLEKRERKLRNSFEHLSRFFWFFSSIVNCGSQTHPSPMTSQSDKSCEKMFDPQGHELSNEERWKVDIISWDFTDTPQCHLPRWNKAKLRDHWWLIVPQEGLTSSRRVAFGGGGSP